MLGSGSSPAGRKLCNSSALALTFYKVVMVAKIRLILLTHSIGRSLCSAFLWPCIESTFYCTRVGRVLSFFSSRHNLDSPNPSPVGECALPFWGEGHTRWRQGLGESQFRLGDIHCGTLYIYILLWYRTFLMFYISVAV